MCFASFICWIFLGSRFGLREENEIYFSHVKSQFVPALPIGEAILPSIPGKSTSVMCLVAKHTLFLGFLLYPTARLSTFFLYSPIRMPLCFIIREYILHYNSYFLSAGQILNYSSPVGYTLLPHALFLFMPLWMLLWWNFFFAYKAFTYFWIMFLGWIPRNRITESKGMNIFNAFNSWHIFIFKIKVNKDSGKILGLYYRVAVNWVVTSLEHGLTAS